MRAKAPKWERPQDSLSIYRIIFQSAERDYVLKHSQQGLQSNLWKRYARRVCSFWNARACKYKRTQSPLQRLLWCWLAWRIPWVLEAGRASAKSICNRLCALGFKQRVLKDVDRQRSRASQLWGRRFSITWRPGWDNCWWKNWNNGEKCDLQRHSNDRRVLTKNQTNGYPNGWKRD